MDVATAGPAIDRYATGAMITTGLGAAWVAGRGFVPVDVRCPFLAATGVPCPFCGITRLSDHVAHGEILDVVSRDPAGLVFIGMLGLLAVVGVIDRLGYLPRARMTRVRSGSMARWIVGILVGALGVHWVTTITTGGFIVT